MSPASIKSLFVCNCIITIAILTFSTPDAYPQHTEKEPVADIREVMNEHSLIKAERLWPYFDIRKIPVAVYDSVSTWLFFSHKAPEGFRPADEDTAVFIYDGQHPHVRGNSVTRFGDVWTATSVLSNHSRRTGERYTTKDMAGIIVHEQFHIFQRTRHPDWRQNDGLLLFYPEETKESLFLRRIEKESFKRAVISGSKKEIAGWAKTAIEYRGERLSKIPAQFGTYEKELQRTEGLSDYIERIARGVDPLNASEITNGIAPAGVRDLGYWEGRWIAMILDKLSPGWKMNLENNDALFLEEILDSVLVSFPYKKQAFSKRENSRIKSDSDSDFDKWQLKKTEEVEAYYNLPGYSIEINSKSDPFNIRIFEPLEIEILPERAVFHRVIFSAANQKGSIRILNHPCITSFDQSYRVVKIIINGLEQVPEVNESEKNLILKYSDIAIELKYSKLKKEGTVYQISL